MKALKRFGAVLITLLALSAVLTGTALAAEQGDGGISVQLNGKPLTFTDAAPESVDGRTFVPLRAVLEAMDAQVDYRDGTIEIHRGGTELTMTPGQNTAAVTEDGQTRTVTMDVTPYSRNNRTYVPVRFVAEAFDCNVGWDNDSKTVIIADIDALLGDAAFDLMDNFSAYCNKQGVRKNMTMDGSFDLNVADRSGELLVKPVSARGSIDGVTGDKGAQLNWGLNLSDLSGLAAADGMEQEIMQGIISALSDLKGEVRADLETGMVYLTLPAVLSGGSENTWHSIDFGAYQTELLGALDMTKLTQLEEAGIREVLAAVLRSMPLDDSQTSYEALAQVASIYTDMLSDQAFTRKGNIYEARLVLEDVVNVTVTFTRRGEDIVSADISMDCLVDEDGDKLTMTMTEHAAPDRVTVEMDMVMDEDGGLDVRFHLDLKCLPTSKAPVTAPPAGAQIIPLS